MNAALTIHPDGRVAETRLPADPARQLDVLYRLIDCHTVDRVALAPGLDMWIDDEGLFTQPPNPPATALARRYGLTRQPYHGTALICGVDRDGTTVHLTESQLADLRAHLAQITTCA